MNKESGKAFKFLKSLESKKFTGKVSLPSEIKGEYNILDFWKRKGGEITITSDFVNALDMSYGQWDKITLVGNFVRADLTLCKIRELDVSRAIIIKLDLTECKIGELTMVLSNIADFEAPDAKISIKNIK
mgnify:CR=1 FL=1